MYNFHYSGTYSCKKFIIGLISTFISCWQIRCWLWRTKWYTWQKFKHFMSRLLRKLTSTTKSLKSMLSLRSIVTLNFHNKKTPESRKYNILLLGKWYKIDLNKTLILPSPKSNGAELKSDLTEYRSNQQQC